MTAGFIRRFPDRPGASVAIFYFTNSLGAAIGVLLSGFVLIGLVGLPGTILTAGIVNILLALIVAALVRHRPEKIVAAPARSLGRETVRLSRILLAASFLTGASSFMYEIGWIRMLNLVLGTSTHAFELMLSAFIFGLAFGGLWIRRRIDVLTLPVRFLAFVQAVMGLLALGTLVAYNASFDVMHAIMQSLTRTDSGYRLFNLASHVIALAVMLPTTFCAGMTLPLITRVLMTHTGGDRSIGTVYAANTFGSIVGIFFAVHVGLPVFGLKGLVSFGAAVDIALGVALLRVARGRRWLPIATGVTAVCVAALIAVTFGVELDRYKMASGVYRTGLFFRPGVAEVLFHKDGKTATVDLIKSENGDISIRTNGKADAQINISDNHPPALDESTMTVFAIVPLALHPSPRTVANIGFGSGLSAHVFLADPDVERVDTIEIEPAMVQAARGFGARVERAYNDSRSHIHFDDAKTFFARHGNRYDIITSEPSNPWVSGVAGLFSDEFYRRVRTHLNPGGLFVQWLQLYEIDVPLVASVMKAINGNFVDYALYASNNGDMIVVARADGPLTRPDFAKLTKYPALVDVMRRVNIVTPQDFALRYLGDRRLSEPLFAANAVPVNSDYFPILDLNAVRTRFTLSNATELLELRALPLPALELLSDESTTTRTTRVTPDGALHLTRTVDMAIAVRDVYTHTIRTLPEETFDANLARHLATIERFAHDCQDAVGRKLWLDSVYHVASVAFAQLRPAETETIWRQWRTSDCYARLAPRERDSLILFGAVGRRDARTMTETAERLLDGEANTGREQTAYLLGAALLGHLARHQADSVARFWSKYGARVPHEDSRMNLMFQLLWAHSAREQVGAEQPNAERRAVGFVTPH